MDVINTCFETTKDYHVIAYYSHLIPVSISLLLGFFVLYKTKFSLLSKVFILFAGLFSFWLIGDVILWTASDYNLIAFLWAPLDYINILFYLFGAYFFFVLIRGQDLKIWHKLGLFTLSLPAWYITVTNKTIPLFNQPWCEAFNSEFLTEYKLILEIVVVLFIIGFAIYSFRNAVKQKRLQIITVATALVLFFGTFSITEYISSQTGIYEINLYSLFVLPLFLGLIIYSITNLETFQIKRIGTQLLVYVMLIMIGSQFFFLENSTLKALTILTFLLSLYFAILLLRGIKKEEKDREKIESLAFQLGNANEKLKSLDKLKTEFLSLASHQLRSPLTSIKGYASMLIEDSFGKMEEKQITAVKRIYDSSEGLMNLVEDLLNVSKIEQGGMKYEMMPTDLNNIVNGLYEEMKIPAENKNLELILDMNKDEKFVVTADPSKIKQVFLNLVDNSIKYTNSGFVKINLKKESDKVVFAVSDSGIGMSKETIPTVFDKFTRGEGSRVNTGGSGLGLYLAHQITLAHKGNIEISSDGMGKGSTFKVSLPELKS